jgi:hypothetical protein
MNWVHLSICILLFGFTGCTVLPKAQNQSNAPQANTQVASIDPSQRCPVMQPINEHPPDPVSASIGGDWYKSSDGRIWAKADKWFTGSYKVPWSRPPGAQIEIIGHRLDGDAPPLQVDIGTLYPESFQPVGMAFETPGCWEVEAKSDGSFFKFIVYVYPRD